MATQRRIDWSFGVGHGPVTGALNAAGATLAATMVADLTHVNPIYAAGAGIITAGAAGISAMVQNLPLRAVCYRGTCWLGAGLWSAATLWLSSPFLQTSIYPDATLAVGTIATGLIGYGLARPERIKAKGAAEAAKLAEQQAAEAEEARIRAAIATEEDRIAYEWRHRLRAICRIPGLDVVNVAKWDPYYGFTLDVDLPDDGTTVNDVKARELELASSANLPPGCKVEVTPSPIGRRAAIIKVATIDAMGETYHLDEDCSKQTINNPIRLGHKQDRTDASINLRFSCAVLVGQTDSGKSNTLNVITHRLGRCTDAVLFAIDKSGAGRYPRPWVRAWKEGRAEAPVIDWCAVTDEEAELMTAALVKLINNRTAAYEQEMFAANDDKIVVTPAMPQIMLLVDEFGTLPDRVKENIEQISDTGRGAAVRVVSCALEATSKYITMALLNQARERIGMRVTDEAQLQYLFDRQWSRGRFDPSAMQHQGSGMFASGANVAEMFKANRLEPNRIDGDSILMAPLRPRMDQVSAELMEEVTLPLPGRQTRTVRGVYSGRWDRMLPLMFPNAGKPAAGRERIVVNGAGGAPTIQAQKEDEVEETPSMAQAAADMEDAVQRALAAADEADRRRAAKAPVADEEWAGIQAAFDMPAVDPRAPHLAGPPQKPAEVDWWTRTLELLHAAGPDGAGAQALAEKLAADGYSTTRQTVSDRLKQEAAKPDGMVRQAEKRAPYVHRDHAGS